MSRDEALLSGTDDICCDRLRLSSLLQKNRADPTEVSEFAMSSRDRTRRLYDLPRTAPALAPLLAPSSIFTSACTWVGS